MKVSFQTTKEILAAHVVTKPPNFSRTLYSKVVLLADDLIARCALMKKDGFISKGIPFHHLFYDERLHLLEYIMCHFIPTTACG